MLRQFGEVLRALGKLIAILPRKLHAHAKEVERGRYCKCCGALAGYYVTTAFRDTASTELMLPNGKDVGGDSLLVTHTPNMYLCQEHHPLMGKKRTETHALLTHPKLEFHLIVPNPFR